MNEEIAQDFSAPVEQATEKMLTQEQVNALVGREKAAAAEKARREVEAHYQSKLQNQNQQEPKVAAQPSAEEMYQHMMQRFNEDAEKRAYEEHGRQIGELFNSKMAQGPEMYEDFKEVMDDIDTNRYFGVSYLAAQMDNTAQIMYELANNPLKLATINDLAKQDEKLARKELQKLSRSISQNEKAKDEYVATNAPLSKMKPSNVSADKGMSTLEDFKSASWLRG